MKRLGVLNFGLEIKLCAEVDAPFPTADAGHPLLSDRYHVFLAALDIYDASQTGSERVQFPPTLGLSVRGDKGSVMKVELWRGSDGVVMVNIARKTGRIGFCQCHFFPLLCNQKAATSIRDGEQYIDVAFRL